MSLPQRQCLILQGEHDWLIEQAQHVYQQANETQRCWLSDDTDRLEFALSSKQALQQLGRDNQLIIFDAQSTFSADAFGSLIGTLQAGGYLLLLLPVKPLSTLWLERFLQLAHSSSAVQFIEQGQQQTVEATFPSPKISKPIKATDEQLEAIEAVFHVVKGHRRRPLVIHADRGRGKSALLGMAAAELLKQGKKTDPGDSAEHQKL
jgi:tRNA(Met) cytidine acetyltransferase